MTDDLAKRLNNKVAMLAMIHKTSPEFTFYHDTRSLLIEAVAEIERLENMWFNRPFAQGPFTGEIK